MTRTPSQANPHGRIFPDVNWSEEEKAKRRAEQKARYDCCYPIFEKLRPELLKDYYNWYLTIEPETGEYFLARDHLSNLKKARQKYPNSIFYTFCINETGACGRI
ncbi:MAG: hypothetical protein ACRDEA_19295 [Microcystaceae cyanobacterium]